jgi:hypothetical protein
MPLLIWCLDGDKDRRGVKKAAEKKLVVLCSAMLSSSRVLVCYTNSLLLLEALISPRHCDSC